MELYQIRHFVAVVEAGSFTKGAERAAVSQPALSASIARLESELGVRLFDRDRSKVTPTASGQKLLSFATGILNECSSLKMELKKVTSPNTLRLGVLQTIASQKIATFLRSYRKLGRDVAIELMDGTHDELQKALSNRRVAVIMTSLDDKASRIPSQIMFTEKYCLAVPVTHPLSKQHSIKLEQLADEPFIVRKNCVVNAEATKVLRARGIKARPVYRTDQDDRVLALVEGGMGIALLPSPPASDRIRVLEIADLNAKRTIGLRWLAMRDDQDLADSVSFAATYNWASGSS